MSPSQAEAVWQVCMQQTVSRIADNLMVSKATRGKAHFTAGNSGVQPDPILAHPSQRRRHFTPVLVAPPSDMTPIQPHVSASTPEEQTARLLEQLMRIARTAALEEMASGIAHELNQPIGAVATFAQAAERMLS